MSLSGGTRYTSRHCCCGGCFTNHWANLRTKKEEQRPNGLRVVRILLLLTSVHGDVFGHFSINAVFLLK